MNTELQIACGGLQAGGVTNGPAALALNLWSAHGRNNVTLRIEDLHERLWRNIPAQFHDLLEIAAYVYCCDQWVRRGQREVDTFGDNWRRRLHFHVPVRVPDLWNGAEVKRVLRETLEFLSDDFYEFTFHRARDAPGLQQYFELELGAAPRGKPEQVIMFSGGLDSLAGAIEETVVKKRRVIMVNHRSTPKFAQKQEELQRLLAQKANPLAPIHVHVRIWKDSDLGREHTQRSRSFLYVSLGATAAMMLGLRSVRFYENGVVSLNLPVCAQVVGGRATRTTHPRVVAGFQRLLSLLAGEAFTVENPFLWETKGDVIRRILKAGCGSLVAFSRSCTHTWRCSNARTHCGTCPQCIDRRFGVISAKAEDFDPVGNYRLDIFKESRPKDEDKIMGAAYLERANQVGNLKHIGQFIAEYPEVTRVLRYLDGSPAGAAERVFDLYKRHAAEVNEGIDVMLGRHLREVRERTLPPDCLLRTVYDAHTVTSLPAWAGAGGETDGRTGETVEAGPRFLLRKGAGMWRLVFDGKEGEIEDGRGIALVAYLLFNPPPGGLHGTELASLVFCHAVVQEASLGADGDSTRKLIQKQAREWMAVLKNPSASEMEKDEAKAELDKLAKALNVTRSDSEGSADKQVRAVRRAIERLIKKLRGATDRNKKPHAALRAFGEHLHQYLWIPSSRFSGDRRARTRAQVAGRFTYERPDDVIWEE